MDKALWGFSFFKPEEFESPDKPGSGYEMNPTFLVRLTVLRKIVNRPFIVTSGFRTREHNIYLKDRGYKASSDSSHLKGLAADIYCPDSTFRYEFIRACYKININRLGISRSFLHIDIDEDKPQNIIWTYQK